MATELTMPKLGEVMESGTVLSWKKAEGQAVAKGEVILEIEADKGAMDVESPVTGVVRTILVPEGTTVPVNTPLAIID
jgi:pyruvate dehydrogenase E2 component (dihydrolipoamide acetyltransferase)